MFETVAEIMVKTTLAILNKDDQLRLILVARTKPYVVPDDLLIACEGMIDEDGQLLRDIQEVLKRS